VDAAGGLGGCWNLPSHDAVARGGHSWEELAGRGGQRIPQLGDAREMRRPEETTARGARNAAVGVTPRSLLEALPCATTLELMAGSLLVHGIANARVFWWE
jgi:hypothetical protein